ncbi:class I SAM-dependent methyltransferase [Parahaliea maris]|uniref:Class I SAM-dependent methyltransferase n=1 Tax=Parahaliea maris TaxID=2716870 RepID=A0A5C8ZQV9_9GAMM|nr:class I SAM-dependent methyltransferase [Parahaliea maris]TXS90848.1 class I SAM-dependent methyltransferase [Parahaliea maris]
MKASSEVQKAFELAVQSYPAQLRWLIENNRKRLLWQCQRTLDVVPKGGCVVDIGGGIVPFMYTCQLLGYETILVDDFSDNLYKSPESKQVLGAIQESGTTVIDGDVFELELDEIPEDLDMVTSHDSMEHWHNSPKWIFSALWNKLSDGGVFWIGVPNAVNLRKRATVPFGRGKWSTMSDWYETEVFRGHVREPDVEDLAYIAQDLGAASYSIEGKNWIGYRSSRPIIRTLTPYLDRVMQIWPSLCSVIYLTAWKRS